MNRNSYLWSITVLLFVCNCYLFFELNALTRKGQEKTFSNSDYVVHQLLSHIYYDNSVMSDIPVKKGNRTGYGVCIKNT